MAWNATKEARIKEIASELKRMTGYSADQLSDKQVAYMRRLTDEGLDLEAQREAHKKGNLAVVRAMASRDRGTR